MRPIIYPYKMQSKSARALQEVLSSYRCKRVRPDGKYKPFSNHLIINWGNSVTPEWSEFPWHDWMKKEHSWLNLPAPVTRATNKLLAFKALQDAGVSIPEFTTEEATAQHWYVEGHKVVGRKQLTGHSGAGIILTDGFDYPASEGGMDVVHMRECYGTLPLYVKYIKKKYEYRVHVFNGKVIDIQQKRKRQGEEVDYQIRSFKRGWVFCREGIDWPCNSISREAVGAVKALGLDFGAVDVIWNSHYQKAYILEVNTAPGLEGTTLMKYKQAIEELL